jgi:hypothetical protein
MQEDVVITLDIKGKTKQFDTGGDVALLWATPQLVQAAPVLPPALLARHG